MESHEECRIDKLLKQSAIPAQYKSSINKAEQRREKAKEIQRMKVKKHTELEEVTDNCSQIYNHIIIQKLHGCLTDAVNY